MTRFLLFSNLISTNLDSKLPGEFNLIYISFNVEASTTMGGFGRFKYEWVITNKIHVVTWRGVNFMFRNTNHIKFIIKTK